jgi:PAS domain-containing protein
MASAYAEAQLRLFVEHTPAAVAMFDREMRYVLFSRRWLTDYGLADQDIVGRSRYEVFADIPERWRKLHQRVLAGSVERCEEDPDVPVLLSSGHPESEAENRLQGERPSGFIQKPYRPADLVDQVRAAIGR